MFKGIKVAALAATALLAASLINEPLLALADTVQQAPSIKQAATMTGYQMIAGSVNDLVASGQAKSLGSLDLNKKLRLAFVLKPRQLSRLEALAQAKGAALSASQYKSEFEPTADTVDTVKHFVSDQQLQVVHQTPGMMIVEGTTAQLQKALHIQMNRYQAQNRSFYSTSTNPVVPTNVASSILGIIGLSEVTYSEKPIKHMAVTTGANRGLFTPDAVRTAYGMIPAYGNHIDGTGRNIAILINGDYDDTAVQTFSEKFGIPYDPNQFQRVIVPNTAQAPAGPDDESTLDVEWAHAIAPCAKVTEYETGDLQEVDLVNGFEQILESNTPPDVVNMSFGTSEEFMSNMDISTWHVLFAEAVAKGITPVAASGDNGAYDPVTGLVSVNHPASDPLVLAVGGTSLTVDQNNIRTAETAWGLPLPSAGYEGSGGGHSNVFTDAQGKPRTVPDVSMVAENLEYNMGGTQGWEIADGTSFAAPMWSGLLALAAQKGNKSLGWVDPAIKSIATNRTTAGVFRDITTGSDGVDTAKTGYDAVTGWGTPANGWSLVQALANAPTGTLSSTPVISGLVVGQNPFTFNQYASYGVGTIDLLGSGFGTGMESVDRVTLSGNGRTYTIPIYDSAIGYNWVDSEIELDLNTLYEEGKAPMLKGRYTVTVSSGTRMSNAFPITFADFIDITAPASPTTITPTDATTKNFQTLQMSVYSPDGIADPSYYGTGKFFFTQTSSAPNAHLAVQQNGHLITPVNGQYPIQFYRGVATVQVATDTVVQPQQEDYVVTANGLIDGFAVSPGFTAGTATAIVGPSADSMYEKVGSDLPVPVYTVDASGNFQHSDDHIRVTVSGANGHVTINGSPVNPEFDGTLSAMDQTNQTALQVSDDTAESFTLTVEDTDTPSVTPYVQTIHVTAASQLAVHVENVNTPVSVPGQDPSYQQVQVTAQDVAGNTVPYAGPVYLKVDDGVDANPSINSIEQQMSDTTWQPLQDLQHGLYKVDLSQTGSTVIRVSSGKLESLHYDVTLQYGDGLTAEAVDSGSFVPAGQEHFSPLVLFPHMATSSSYTPEYDEVQIMGADVNNNLFISSSTTATIQEAPGGPDVVLGTRADDGTFQPGQQTATGWTVTLNNAEISTLEVMSSQPGVAEFTISDPANSQIGSSTFQIDFVNSMPTNLQVNEPTSVGIGSVQTVSAQVVDTNGQPVVNATDTMALTIGSHGGYLTVMDSNGKPLSVVQGQYITNAVAGVATFHVKDSKPETLSYTLTDRTQPLGTSQFSGTFLPLSVAPLASMITVANNQAGTPDTVTVQGLAAGDVVNVYDTATKNNLLGTSDPVTDTTATVNMDQIGRVAGKLYVTVTSTGKGESAITQKAYLGELSDMLTPDQVLVVNNLAKPDTVTVNGLKVGDVIKVYSSDTGGTLLAHSVPVTAGHTTTLVSIQQIGALAGNVYITVTSAGMQESNRTQKSFDPEPTATPSARNFAITNQLDNPDTVNVRGVTTGDVVKIYSDLTSQVPLVTSDPVASGNVTTTLTIDQLGTTAGSVYATVTSAGKLESARIKINYAAEPTPALSQGQVSVINNMGRTRDTIQVNSLQPGDVIKVYTVSTGGYAFTSQTVAASQNAVTISCYFPGATAGNIYVTITSTGLLESKRTSIAYLGEQTVALSSNQMAVTNGQGATDSLVVNWLSAGEIVNVYGSADPSDSTPIATQTVDQGQSRVSFANLDLVTTGGTLYVTVTRPNQLESVRVGKSYGPEATLSPTAKTYRVM